MRIPFGSRKKDQPQRRGALTLPGWLRRRGKAPEGEIVIDPMNGAMRMTPWGPRPLTGRQRRQHEKRLAEQGQRMNRAERREAMFCSPRPHKQPKVGTPAQRRAFGARMCRQALLIRARLSAPPQQHVGRTDID